MKYACNACKQHKCSENVIRTNTFWQLCPITNAICYILFTEKSERIVYGNQWFAEFHHPVTVHAIQKSARRFIFGRTRNSSLRRREIREWTFSHFCAVACLHDIIIFVNAQLNMHLDISMTVSRNTHPILCVFSSISWLFHITKCLLWKRNIQFISSREVKRREKTDSANSSLTLANWHMQCARSETIGVSMATQGKSYT